MRFNCGSGSNTERRRSPFPVPQLPILISIVSRFLIEADYRIYGIFRGQTATPQYLTQVPLLSGPALSRCRVVVVCPLLLRGVVGGLHAALELCALGGLRCARCQDPLPGCCFSALCSCANQNLSSPCPAPDFLFTMQTAGPRTFYNFSGATQFTSLEAGGQWDITVGAAIDLLLSRMRRFAVVRVLSFLASFPLCVARALPCWLSRPIASVLPFLFSFSRPLFFH